jgi:predicted transcriptional regulator
MTAQRGTNLVELGPLEADIMDTVWTLADRQRGGITVRQVWEVLVRRKRAKKLAYTTVMTVMTTLGKKGYLRVNAQSKPFTYRPKKGRREVMRRMAGEINRFLASDECTMVVEP